MLSQNVSENLFPVTFYGDLYLVRARLTRRLILEVWDSGLASLDQAR
jgi:hypothetical protein